MFIAVSTRTMASARPKIAEPEKWVGIEEIRARKRAEAEAERRRQAIEELERREAEDIEGRRRKKLAEVEAALLFWRASRHERYKTPAKQIATKVCEAEGVTFEELIGPSRRVKLVELRDRAIRAVADERPDLSLPALGRLFGNRDHTTILHSLRKTRKDGQSR